MRVPVTLLYVPGDRPGRVAKAYRSGADSVVIDLEDAVAPAAKDAVREGLGVLLASLPQPGGAPPGEAGSGSAPGIQVRVNAAGSPWHEADLVTVATLPPSVAVRLPKAESVDAVGRLCDRLAGRAVHLLLESALGVERAYDLATCHPAVATIGLGEADLRADLGVTGEDALAWARSRVVNAAAAAGLPAPTMSVYADVADLDGLARSCATGRALGFVGRAAIHPRQLEAIRTAFAPTPDEVARALQVLAAAERAAAAGVGAFALADGGFVDEAVLRQARRIAALAADLPAAGA